MISNQILDRPNIMFGISDGFKISTTSPRYEELEANASLAYYVNPWPPPYKFNNSDYERVTVTYTLQSTPPVKTLCTLEYVRGE